MSQARVLVVEDDEDIFELISHNLMRNGFQVTGAATGEDALKKSGMDRFDCILLDLMLPGIDGLEVCRVLKRSPVSCHIPVIIVSAKGEEADVVTGLELGADDYVVKPFSPRVLIARIKSVLRRKAKPVTESDVTIGAGDIRIHPGRHEVLAGGNSIDLTPMEFKVLYFLASRPGWVFTRYQIMDAARDDNYPVTDRAVDVLIVGLRKKLGTFGALIETVRGIGYRFKE